MTDQGGKRLKCNIVEAMVWNESAWSIGLLLRDFSKKARGNNIILFKDGSYLVGIVPTAPKSDFCYSQECINKHTGLDAFYRNPVIP